MRRSLVALFLTGALVRPALGQTVQLPPAPGLPPAPMVLPPGNPPNAPAQGLPAQGLPAQGLPLQGSAAQASPFPLEMAIIDPKGVEVRSGPTMEYFATSRLRYGERVIVLRESKDQPGWYAITPPPGSFSWIDARHVKQVNAQIGYVEGEGNGAVAVLPGSTIVNKEPNVESAKVASGFLATLLDRPMEVSGRKWFPIVPPPSEVRFIPKDAVQAPQAATVAPTNWARTNPGPGAWTSPGQLIGNTSGPTVGTPASLTQPASQWTQYNGIATQPPQWSQWGKLNRTAIQKDGQPVFRLDDRQGRPLLYVTSVAGTSLQGYLGQMVCLYGSISYRAEERTYYITASHVATP